MAFLTFMDVILFCLVAPSISEPTLILSPSVVTTFVGDDVTFLCMKSDPSLQIAWNPVSNIFLTDNKNISPLIIGVPDNTFNNTEIYCVGRYPSEPSQLYFSNTGKIIIQSILSEVDVNVFRKDVCTVQLSWVPPFTLPGVLILGYNVNITNLDNDITSSSFINNTDVNITLGYDYYVSIAAVNGAGEGNQTTIEINSTELLNFIEGFNININSITRYQNEWKVDSTVDVTRICGNADAKFVYKFCKSVANAPCFSTTNIRRIDLSNNQALFSTSLFLPEDQHYDVQVEAIVGKNVLSSSGTSLSTFDIQSVEEINLHAYPIICLGIYYVTGSAATGCKIKLDCDYDDNDTFLFTVDGYNNQFHNFWCSPELQLIGNKTCLLQVYDRVGQVNQNASGPAVTSIINVTSGFPSVTCTLPTISNYRSNCSTEVTIAIVVSFSILIIIIIILLLLLSLIFRLTFRYNEAIKTKHKTEDVVLSSCKF